jgi:hypothetical protein
MVTSQQHSTSDITRQWLVPGLAAGLVFLAFEMLAGAMSTSAWQFPEAIAQTIGIGSPTAAFQPTSLVAGIAIHFSFSVALGILFVAIAQRLRLCGARLLIGAIVFMYAESAISIWAVLHTFFPATLPVLLGAVPFWASLVGRTAFGVTLGLTLASSPTRVSS